LRILIFLSHPAQFLFFRAPVNRLKQFGHEVHILIKSKDILQDLVSGEGWAYKNILPSVRGNSKPAILYSLLLRDIRITRYVRKHKIQLLAGTDASLAHAGRLLGIPCITTTEDDYKVIKYLAKLTYPFSTIILAPLCCDTGKWESKKIGYPGFMKLSYLHPAVFTPDPSKLGFSVNESYFLLRLSGLKAHHDYGEAGITETTLRNIILKLTKKGKVYISSEKELPADMEKYRITIPVADIHHFLYFSQMLISDSQSMSVEAAMLGTPGIRISSFSGRISVLEELEKKYNLTYGILPGHDELLMSKMDEILNMPDAKGVFQKRRERMLEDKINVSEFVTWLIHAFPESVRKLKQDPEYVLSFQGITQTQMAKK
jgi:uncharacterized protein